MIEPELIKERLSKIKDERLFIDREETFEGGTGIGAPVFDANGNCIAAIGIIGPTVQIIGDLENKSNRND